MKYKTRQTIIFLYMYYYMFYIYSQGSATRADAAKK